MTSCASMKNLFIFFLFLRKEKCVGKRVCARECPEKEAEGEEERGYYSTPAGHNGPGILNAPGIFMKRRIKREGKTERKMAPGYKEAGQDI